FPFGYGLSYTSFSIGNVTVDHTTVSKDGTVTLTIPVSNIGKRSGTEIVQVYIRKADDTNGPLKTLREFKRMKVAAGKTGTAIITLPYKAFEFYSSNKLEMTVAPGDYEVWYGNSSATKDLRMIKVVVQ
ncbi:MAG: fibronectin type III-like domain-contianing protein, partial [Bacteroidia bacterium]|nr:fibronectin type III-like domain-contianing protein [Bacteroidia bacterium]